MFRPVRSSGVAQETPSAQERGGGATPTPTPTPTTTPAAARAGPRGQGGCRPATETASTDDVERRPGGRRERDVSGRRRVGLQANDTRVIVERLARRTTDSRRSMARGWGGSREEVSVLVFVAFCFLHVETVAAAVEAPVDP